MRSGPPVPGNDLGGGQGLVAFLGCCEGAVQLRLQAIDGFALCAFLVAPDEIADVLADVLVSATLADIGRDELAEGAADADGHGRCAGHGTHLLWAPLSS